MSEEKVNLITRNLQEILGLSELKEIVSRRSLRIYWGTAITGRPHIGYVVPLLKIKDFVDAGCSVKILLADIHGFLDNLKAPLDKVEKRCRYYEKLIKSILKMLCVDVSGIEFVKGSEYQRSERYTMDLYKILSITSEHDAKKAGSQVVKQVENPMVSSLIYPAMQALDEEHLGVDAQFGGVDQRKIFTYARKYLPQLRYGKRIHLMNGMVPGLGSEKMSSSDETSKIDFMDSRKEIERKIKKSFCEEGNKESGVLGLFSHIIFPAAESRGVGVSISDREGRSTRFCRYSELEEAFVRREVHPGDLKNSAIRLVEEMVGPVREEMCGDLEMVRQAYE